jgi:hypothetical protein
MKRRGFFNKKGDTLVLESVIFIVLNIFFVMGLLYFVSRSASGAVVYEEAYAKQIALLVDNARPGDTIVLNMENGVNVANENGRNRAEIAKKKIFVGLGSQGGYEIGYFTGYNISIIKNLDSDTKLTLQVTA